ncbi:hypothetical protein GCM10009623_01050 [Nocardioides aestuarii]
MGLALLLMSAVGCSNAADPIDAAPRQDASTTSERSPDPEASNPGEMEATPRCDALVAPSQVRALGGLLGDSEELPGTGRLLFCEWRKGEQRLLVIHGPAADWSPFLPDQVKQLRASQLPISATQDRALDVGLRRAVQGKGVCQTVTTMAQIVTGDPQADIVGRSFGPTVLQLDTCIKDVFTRVLLDASTVQEDPDSTAAEAQKLLQALVLGG